MSDFVFKDSVAKQLDDHFMQMETNRKKKFNASKNNISSISTSAASTRSSASQNPISGPTVDRRQRASDRYAEEHQASITGKTSDYIRELNTYEVKLGDLERQMEKVSTDAVKTDTTITFQNPASLRQFQNLARDYQEMLGKYDSTLKQYRNKTWDETITQQRAQYIKEALDQGEDPVKVYPGLEQYGKTLPFTKDTSVTEIEKYLFQRENSDLELQIPAARQRTKEASREHARSSADMVVANQDLEAARAALDEAARNLDMFPGEESQKAYEEAQRRVEEAQAAFDAPNQKLDSVATELGEMRNRYYMNKYWLDFLDLSPELAEQVKLIPKLEDMNSTPELATEYRRAQVELNSAEEAMKKNPNAETQKAYEEAKARVDEIGSTTPQAIQDQIRDIKKALEDAGYSEESIDRLIEVSRQEYNANKTAEMLESISNAAVDNPFAAIGLSLLSVPMTLVSAVGFLGKAVDICKNQFGDSYTPIDWNSESMQPGLAAQAIRGSVSEAIGDSWAGPVGAFLYQLGMSTLDSGAVAFLTATTGLPAYHLLSGSAATSAMLDAKQRGATDGQALVYGLMNGFAESIFEKCSIERLLNMKVPTTRRQIITNALKQGGAEASEEFNTFVANWITDGLVMGDRSIYNLAKQEALDDGATKEEAERTALLTMLNDMSLNVLGGFFSGGVIGGFRSLQMYEQYNGDMRQVGRAIRTERSVADELEKAKLLGVRIPDKLDSAYKNGTALDDKLLGELALSNEGAEISLINNVLATQDPQAVAAASPFIRSTGDGNVMGTMSAEDVAVLQTTLKELRSSPDGNQTRNARLVMTTQDEQTMREQTNAEAQISPRLDSIETAFTDQGMQMKTAEKKAAVVRKLMAGELITQKEANVLDIANPSVRSLVSQITGVQIPQRGELTPAALQELFRNAASETDMETASAVSSPVDASSMTEGAMDYREAAKSPERMAQARTIYAEETGDVDADGKLFPTYKEFSDRYRAKVNSNATDTEVALAYQQYLDDAQTRPFAGRRVTFSEFREQMRSAPGGDQLSESDIRTLFDQTSKTRDFADVVREAAKRTQTARRDSAVSYLKKALSKTGIKDIVVEYDGVFAPEARVSGGIADAYIQDGVIHLNGNHVTTEKAVYYVLGHELTHQAYDADGAQILTDILDTFRQLDARGAIASDSLSDRVRNIDREFQDIRERYGKVMEHATGLKRPWMAEEELAGDLMGYLFGDPKVMDAILGVKPSLIDRALSLVRRMIGKRGGNADVDQLLQRLSNRFAEALRKSAETNLKKGTPLDVESEIRYSIEFDGRFMDRAERQNHGAVPQNVMDQARKDRTLLAEYLSRNREALRLPQDIMGDTEFRNSAYDLSEENTTVCIRSMAAEDLMDAVAEHLGRPLTLEDTLTISQELFRFTDKPECLYCYVAMDRKANRQYLGRYIQQRDAVLRDLRSGMDYDQAFEKFLAGRKPTNSMKNRFQAWAKATDLITLSDVASQKNMAEAVKRNPDLAWQIADAKAYARSAARPQKQVGYAAYNNHILEWSTAKVNTLNQHYGMRMYSFSDFSPAFILEDMQRVTDAAVKGLKVLAYTKELDFARIFAPSGMSINISVFGYDDGNGGVAQDGMQGADWAETRKLRDQYPGVGAVFVATNDHQVEWALDQDWIDVVLPFYKVHTGSAVAKYFGWTDYTRMSSDIKRAQNGWMKGQDASSIYPNEHQNNKEMYLAACEDNHLTPRFEKWVHHPNYMKLVNETRLPEAATNPVQPIFNTEAAYSSLEEMRKRGGYYVPIGGTLEEMQGIASEIAEKLPADARFSLREVDGKNVVWLENSSLTNKELNNHKTVANFIAQHIGEVYTILESGQKVYIGPDLPSEYTQSRYTSLLRDTDRAGFRAKRRAVDGLGEMIEIASNRRWEPTRHTQNKDAKYGMYRYDSTFAFPVKAPDGSVQRVRAYDAELLIRNASDGKKYLYDIVNIKENTSAQSDLTKREARLAAYRTATGGDVFNTTISDPAQTGKTQNPGRGNVQYSLSDEKPYAEQLHEVLAGESKLQSAGNLKSAIYVAKEPTALLQKLGFGDYPLVMTQEHAVDSSAQRWDLDGNLLPGAQYNHQIPEIMLAELPELIEQDVAAVFRSDSGEEQTRGTVLLLTTQVDDQGNPIVISLRPNGTSVVYHGKEGPAHVVTSVYGQENFDQWLQNQVQLDTILFVDENKARAVPVGTFGTSFASWYAGIHPQGFDTTLGQRNQTVNRENLGSRRYSISEEYESDVRAWDEAGRPDDEVFILGPAGDVLQGLGAVEQDIYLRGEKVNAILHDHPEMTLDEIRHIPEILDDPVLVLKSSGQGSSGMNTRLLVFGAASAHNGRPVLTVLDLRPVGNRLVVSDLQQVNSAYGRHDSGGDVLNSDVLYADETRTIPLLQTMGLRSHPTQLKQYGSIGRISHNGQNIAGVPFSEVVQIRETDRAPEESSQNSAVPQPALPEPHRDGTIESPRYRIKSQRGRSIELETMENNRFERLQSFGKKLPVKWYAYTSKYFYVYYNDSFTDYTTIKKLRLVNANFKRIDKIVEECNDAYRNGETIDS